MTQKKHRPTTHVKHCGKYTVVLHPSGCKTIYGDGLRERGFYVPSDKFLRSQFYLHKHPRKGKKPRVTMHSLRTMISWRAVLEGNRRNLTRGYDTLRLPHKCYLAEDLVETVRQFWAPSVKAYYGGAQDNLPRVRDFIKQEEPLYHASVRTFGGFQRIFERAFPPEHYPDLYLEVHQRSPHPEEIHLGRLSDKILTCYATGRPIARTEALKSPFARERKMARMIIALARGGQKKKEVHPRKSSERFFASSQRAELEGAKTYVEVIEKLTGIGAGDISMTPVAKLEYGAIAEKLVHTLFVWSPLTGISLEPYAKEGTFYLDQESRTFYYGRKRGIADGRIDFDQTHQGIEVKTGISASHPQTIDNIVEKYGSGKARWNDGKPMNSVLAVIHENPLYAQEVLPMLHEKGILTMDYPTFHTYLGEVVAGMKRKYAREIEKLAPRIHNLDYLLTLHEQIALTPSVLTRASNASTREWSLKVLKGLLGLGTRLQHGD